MWTISLCVVVHDKSVRVGEMKWTELSKWVRKRKETDFWSADQTQKPFIVYVASCQIVVRALDMQLIDIYVFSGLWSWWWCWWWWRFAIMMKGCGVSQGTRDLQRGWSSLFGHGGIMMDGELIGGWRAICSMESNWETMGKFVERWEYINISFCLLHKLYAESLWINLIKPS